MNNELKNVMQTTTSMIDTVTLTAGATRPPHFADWQPVPLIDSRDAATRNQNHPTGRHEDPRNKEEHGRPVHPATLISPVLTNRPKAHVSQCVRWESMSTESQMESCRTSRRVMEENSRTVSGASARLHSCHVGSPAFEGTYFSCTLNHARATLGTAGHRWNAIERLWNFRDVTSNSQRWDIPVPARQQVPKGGVRSDQGRSSMGRSNGARQRHFVVVVGGATAVGNGMGYQVPVAGPVSAGHFATAVIAAFDLGKCDKHWSYLRVRWYFPGHNPKFVQPKKFESTCNNYSSSKYDEFGS